MSEKKPRSLPHVWQSFWSLPIGDGLFLGPIYLTKTSLFFARVTPGGPGGVPHGNRHLVLPWRRVKTTKLVRRSPRIIPDIDETIGEKIRAVNAEQCAIVGDQPVSDNGITGPTA